MSYLLLIMICISRSFVQGRVLIVGAGAAGLSAAKDLLEDGIDVLVLESTQSVGGRAKAGIIGKMADGRPYYVHFGANWVHGQGDNPVWKLNEKYGFFNTTWIPGSYLNVFENGESEVVYGDHDVPGQQIRDDFFNYCANSTENLAWLKGQLNPLTPSIAPSFSRNFFVERYIREKNLTGRDLQRFELFTKVYDDEDVGSDDCAIGYEFHLSYGNDKEMMVGYPSYNALFEFLAEDVDIRFDQEVVNITWGKNGVKVMTNQGNAFEGDAVIVTVSIGVLQAEKITFIPELPAWKRKSIYQGIAMSSLEGIHLFWDNAWWPNLGAFWRATNSIQKTTSSRYTLEWYNMNMLESMPYPALKVTTYGEVAKWFDNLSDEKVIDILMEELTLILETQPTVPDPIPRPKQMIRSGHWNNGNQLGAYLYWTTDAPGAAQGYLAEPIANRLFFAGEATSNLRAGYVDGAMETGQDVAKNIKHLLEVSGGTIPWVDYNDKLPISREKEIRKLWYDEISAVLFE